MPSTSPASAGLFHRSASRSSPWAKRLDDRGKYREAVDYGCIENGKVATMKLCKPCRNARDDKVRTPTHLVHPEHSAVMVFDVHGIAVCPSCGAVWHRDRNKTVLMNQPQPNITS